MKLRNIYIPLKDTFVSTRSYLIKLSMTRNPANVCVHNIHIIGLVHVKRVMNALECMHLRLFDK